MTDDMFFEELRTDKKNIKQDDIKGVFFRLFNTEDGKKVLSHLREVTLEKTTLPDVHFAGSNMSHLMCVREGENNLFRYILNMQKKGVN